MSVNKRQPQSSYDHRATPKYERPRSTDSRGHVQTLIPPLAILCALVPSWINWGKTEGPNLVQDYWEDRELILRSTNNMSDLIENAQ